MDKMTGVWAIGVVITAVGCGNAATSPDAASAERSVDIVPDPTGWVDRSTNSVMLQGAWYAYGDGRARGQVSGKCQAAGHADSECSTIALPSPTTAGFPQDTPGRMCTTGTECCSSAGA